MRISSTRSAALAALVLSLAPLGVSAQAAPTSGGASREAATAARAAFLADIDTLQSKFLALAEAIPADKYAWRPGTGVRSVGEAFMHVASEYYVFVPITFGATPSPLIPRTREGFEKFEASSAKADVLEHLREGFAYGRQAVAAVDAASLTGTRRFFGTEHTYVETASLMSGDLHEHLGQLIAYARVNGVTPPWSR
jgi:uncharacterized damage-inducible protein DinB